MVVIKFVTALFMVLLGAAVAVNFIASLFYDPQLEGAGVTVWRILDPMMVAGVFIVLLMANLAKRRLDSDRSNTSFDRQYVEANVVYYFSAFLLPVLLWNWISFEWVEPASDMPLLWIFIDVSVPILLTAVGTRILRGDSAFDCIPAK